MVKGNWGTVSLRLKKVLGFCKITFQRYWIEKVLTNWFWLDVSVYGDWDGRVLVCNRVCLVGKRDSFVRLILCS
uniref:Uncharacterized protein n=1 Tax=Manihot esculenta TaxID=3983 RepID=A0A2C9UMV5_MANES